MHKNLKEKGFTVVELLIVIVVIAILAAISVVSYTGMQKRALDSVRKQDIGNVAKALALYRVDNGDVLTTGSGCGASGSGEGWVSHRSSLGGATSYPRSVTDCLMDKKYLSSDVVDPSGCTDNARAAKCAAPRTTSYMKINCSASGQNYAYLMARLESTSNSKPADMNSTTCANHSFFDTYGMNYAVRVD